MVACRASRPRWGPGRPCRGPATMAAAPRAGRVEPRPWWLCLDMDVLHSIVADSRARLPSRPLLSSVDKYYSRAAATRLVADLNLHRSTAVQTVRMEVWPTHEGGGRRAFVDLAFNQQVATVEVHDDGFREPSTVMASFSARASPVVFVSTVFNRPETLARWLAEMAQLHTAHPDRVAVCLIGFDQDQPSLRNQLAGMGSVAIQRLLESSIVDVLPGGFRKTAGLQQCLNTLPEDTIAFMTDIDISLPADILARVSRYVSLGIRAFNPIVYYLCPKGGSLECWETGWGDGGPGIVALYVADARRFGGYDDRTYGGFHGFEDTDFFLRIKYSGLEVVRKREASVIHNAHPKGAWRIDREKQYPGFEDYWKNKLSQSCEVYLSNPISERLGMEVVGGGAEAEGTDPSRPGATGTVGMAGREGADGEHRMLPRVEEEELPWAEASNVSP
eukprot:TRINITY_DN5660_c0_g1_i4.p1 TRINITY_DN5660_c0_g1~~TRINITY_DN5660_c0_g1_i4.p1  ORF type:complete len:446 (+),score=50.37 TRINITY_DN5660_c0_g1_i4:82-1419(+)